MIEEQPGSYYEQITAETDALGDGRYLPTSRTEGAWSSHEQHMAPVGGLLWHAIEARSARSDLATARISFDILGMIHRREVTIRSQVLRPGRTIELVGAEMIDGADTEHERVLVRATAWRLQTSDTSGVADIEQQSMPGPDEGKEFAESIWSGGYIDSLEFRVLPGARPGRGQVWVRAEPGLIAGQQVTDGAALIGLVDTANGVAVRRDPREMLFPNVDLSIHVFREPTGQWLGLDTTVSFGPRGVGLTASVLHDLDGPFGTAEQSLTLRERPPA